MKSSSRMEEAGCWYVRSSYVRYDDGLLTEYLRIAPPSLHLSVTPLHRTMILLSHVSLKVSTLRILDLHVLTNHSGYMWVGGCDV